MKIYGVPGPGPSTGGEDFSKKLGGAQTFSKKKYEGSGDFFRRRGFFTTKFGNPRFNFSKKAILDDQKVIYVGSSHSTLESVHWRTYHLGTGQNLPGN